MKPRWSRKKGQLVKSASLSEGEVISLLLSSKGLKDSDLFDAAYASTKEFSTTRTKAFSILVTTTIIAILVKFEVISSFSTSGLSLAKDAFKPMALAGYSVAGLHFAYFHSRYRFFELWFQSVFDKSEPGKRAELLLRYPIAFDLAKMDPVVRGLPEFVHTKNGRIFKSMGIVLVAIALLIFTFLSLALWLSLAYDVWLGAFPNQIVAGSVIAGSVVTTLVSAVLPFSGGAKAVYEHYGLVEQLTKLEQANPERHKQFLRKLAHITKQSGPS